jgi:hypothetical protein
VPALIADAVAGWPYVEFFTANIRNPNTRRAFARACSRFFAWCEDRGLTPTTDPAVRCRHLCRDTREDPLCARREAAVRGGANAVRLADHRPVAPSNPASAVRGPMHVLKTATTPVLEGKEWRRMVDAVPADTVRDRALIATLIRR